MDKRFLRNIPTLSEAEQELLGSKRVLVLGCGGLGGYICEYLARAGVGAIIAADGDCFEETNLNRQLLSLESTLGQNKALVAKKRAMEINPNIDFRAFPEFFSRENARELMRDIDIVIDALDSVSTRLVLEEECTKRGLLLVHGAVSGWNLQVGVFTPGRGMLRRLYGGVEHSGGKSCLSITPAMCAAIQAAEALKILCGRPSALENKLMLGDMESMTFDIVEF